MENKSDTGKFMKGTNLRADSGLVDNFLNKISPYFPLKNYFMFNSETKDYSPHNMKQQDLQNKYKDKHQSLMPGHIILPTHQAPEGYICVGRVMETPTKKGSTTPSQNGIFFLNENPAMMVQEIPTSFNPRNAANMPSKEKVNKWIQNIPFHLNSENDITVDCFPAVTSYSSSNSCSEDNIDLGELEAMLEFQARKVTRYATMLYDNEDEPVARLDDDYEDEYYDSDGNLIDFNDDVMPHVDTSLGHYHTNRDADYIIQATF
ncbi:uncharacterized protein PRCAT00000382001 [Priceomyces carsonii]|uniref:uncharacterized protein n=1 Tax=Priceomyces carsonii TaxID=28549 RepID=UPI002EDABA74|nr:unnamed protein product [Priceomyces carsonii]